MREVRGRRIALVPQQPMTSLSPTSTIGKQMGWYLGELLEDPEIHETLTSIGLRPVLDRAGNLPQGFSGGQLQRLLIAIASLAHKPALMLADEPTTTLDATVQAQVLRLLLDMRAKLGLSILYVSHDLAVIAQVCDRVGVMYGGRLVEVASVQELFDAPKHPYTQALIAAMPSASADDERLQSIPGTAAGANRLAGCPFAPRCPRADDQCRTAMPEAETIGTRWCAATTWRCRRESARGGRTAEAVPAGGRQARQAPGPRGARRRRRVVRRRAGRDPHHRRGVRLRQVDDRQDARAGWSRRPPGASGSTGASSPPSAPRPTGA